jgi:hypothetical protein
MSRPGRFSPEQPHDTTHTTGPDTEPANPDNTP